MSINATRTRSRVIHSPIIYLYQFRTSNSCWGALPTPSNAPIRHMYHQTSLSIHVDSFSLGSSSDSSRHEQSLALKPKTSKNNDSTSSDDENISLAHGLNNGIQDVIPQVLR